MVYESSMIFFHSITSLFKRKPDYCIHLIKLFCCKYCFSYCNNIFSLSWNFIFSQKLIPEMYLRLMRIGKTMETLMVTPGWADPLTLVLPTRTCQSSSSFIPSRSFVFSSWDFFLQIFAVTWARLS